MKKSIFVPQDSRGRRLAAWSLCVALFVSGIFFIFYLHPRVMQGYIADSPDLPMTDTGQVDYYNQHGKIVYLSHSQEMRLLLLQLAGVTQLIAAGLAWKFLSRSQQVS